MAEAYRRYTGTQAGMILFRGRCRYLDLNRGIERIRALLQRLSSLNECMNSSRIENAQKNDHPSRISRRRVDVWAAIFFINAFKGLQLANDAGVPLIEMKSPVNHTVEGAEIIKNQIHGSMGVKFTNVIGRLSRLNLSGGGCYSRKMRDGELSIN
jgi:DNA-binding transcriptional MerR regulator